MNAAKKNRLSEAKLAKAYMAGGMAPQQAAWKCGFKRVDAMNETIAELEKAEESERETGHLITTCGGASPRGEANDGEEAAYLPNAAVMVEFGQQEPKDQPWRTNRPAEAFKPPLEKWQNNAAIIHYFGQNGSYSPMFKVMTPKNSYHIQFGVDEMKDAAKLMCIAAGVKLASQAAEDLAETEEEPVREAKEHTEELQRNAELEERLREMEQKLVQEQERRKEAEVTVQMLQIRVESLETEKAGGCIHCERLEAAHAEIAFREREMVELKAKAFEKLIAMM